MRIDKAITYQHSRYLKAYGQGYKDHVALTFDLLA